MPDFRDSMEVLIDRGVRYIAAMRVLEDMVPQRLDVSKVIESVAKATGDKVEDQDVITLLKGARKLDDADRIIAKVHRKYMDKAEEIAKVVFPYIKDPLGKFEENYKNLILCEIEKYWYLRSDEKCKT